MYKKTIGLALLFLGVGILLGYFLGFSAFILGGSLICIGIYFLTCRY